MRCAGPVRITRCAGFIAIENIYNKRARKKKNKISVASEQTSCTWVHASTKRSRARTHTSTSSCETACRAPRCVKLRSCERPHQRRKRVAARRRRSIANARTARTVRAKLANQTTLSILSYLELKSGALCTAVKPHAHDNTTRAIVFTLQTNQNKTNNYREKNVNAFYIFYIQYI